MEIQEQEKFECCPPFNPVNWDDKLVEWKDKTFIKDHVRTVFYMPLNFGSVMKRLDKHVQKAEAKMPDWLGLSDHTSSWNMDIYLAVDKLIPDADNVSLSGNYYFKVYEGAFNDTGKWCQDFEHHIQSKGLKAKKNVYVVYHMPQMCQKVW